MLHGRMTICLSPKGNSKPFRWRYEQIAGYFRPELCKALEKVGFYFKRQEGNHVVLPRNEPFAQIVIPIIEN